MSTRDKDLQEAADALNALFGQPALDQPYQVTDIRQIVASAIRLTKALRDLAPLARPAILVTLDPLRS